MNRNTFLRKAVLLAGGIALSFDKAFGSSADDALWLELIDYARWCPSPHNVQPWKIKLISRTEAHLYYDPQRVPGVVDDKTSFTIVGMGMFIECLHIAAQPRGYKVIAAHEAEPQLITTGTAPRLFARLYLQPSDGKELPDRELIKERRTSRLHYDGGKIPDVIMERFKRSANSCGYRLAGTSDDELIRKIIHLNTATVLERSDDMPTMNEMRQWVRTTDQEAAEKKDGLWSKANATPGRMMHNFFFHHHRFDHGWKKNETRKLLDKGMNGTASIAWISGPFSLRADWTQAGKMLLQLWLEMTLQGIYMHPLGTVITTPGAKEKFLKLANEQEKDGTVWFLVRMGYSKEPPRSYRLQQNDILIT